MEKYVAADGCSTDEARTNKERTKRNDENVCKTNRIAF